MRVERDATHKGIPGLPIPHADVMIDAMTEKA